MYPLIFSAGASPRPTLWDVNHIHGRPHIQPPLCKGCGSPVETSAFNAEAPTEPAGETVGCRRQLGGIVRLILYDFVKSLSHFLFPKNDRAESQASATHSASKTSAGVFQSRHFLGRWLIRLTTLSTVS